MRENIEYNCKTGITRRYTTDDVVVDAPIQKSETEKLKDALIKKGLITESELNEKI